MIPTLIVCLYHQYIYILIYINHLFLHPLFNYTVPDVSEFMDDHKTNVTTEKKINITPMGQFSNLYFELHHTTAKTRRCIGGCDLISILFVILIVQAFKHHPSIIKSKQNASFPFKTIMLLLFSKCTETLNKLTKDKIGKRQVLNTNEDCLFSGSHKEGRVGIARKRIGRKSASRPMSSIIASKTLPKTAYRGKPPS